MTLKLIQEPSSEPISVADAKAYMRVDNNVEDALIGEMIASARAACEHEIGRALISQTWERVLDAFPDAEIELGWPTVQGITSVSYIDRDGVTVNLDAANYVLDNVVTPGWLFPAADTDWPETYPTINAVRVRFVSGYGENGDAVPDLIKRWILVNTASLYRARESFVIGTIAQPLPDRFTDRLLDRYRTHWTM